MNNFTHLHVHSEYSILDSIGKSKDIVSTAKAKGFKSIAITDHGNINAWIKFYIECQNQGNEIKPIYGIEAYLDPYNEGEVEKRKNYHITLLAKDLEGWHNILKLNNIAQREHFYYKPRINIELLNKYSKGIICLSGCPGGCISENIYKDNDIYITYAKTLKEIFAKPFSPDTSVAFIKT